MPEPRNSLAGLRERNLSRVLTLIRDEPGIWQSQIASTTQLASGAVSSMVNDLLSLRLSSAASEVSGVRGRPRVSLRLDDSVPLLIGARVTRNAIEVRSATLAGRTLATVSRRLDSSPSLSGAGDVLASMLESLKYRPPCGAALAISVPGSISGGQVGSSELGWLGDTDELTAGLQARFSRKIMVGNDGSFATLAEHRRGAAMGLANTVVVLFTSGIGGSAVLDGRLLGHQGSSPGFGHVPIQTDGPRCECGRTGCLELFASLQAFAVALDDDKELNRDGPGVYAQRLAERAASGEQPVIDILTVARSSFRRFGEVVSSVLEPHQIIMTGDATPLFPWIRDEEVSIPSVPVRVGNLGPQAALVGAVQAAQEIVLISPLVPFDDQSDC
jgi:predicted NBD/HSP70 family sugar kinase